MCCLAVCVRLCCLAVCVIVLSYCVCDCPVVCLMESVYPTASANNVMEPIVCRVVHAYREREGQEFVIS